MADPMSWMRNDRGDTIDAALAVAAQRGTQVLALWTASWCPPCNELQLMVLDSPLFARCVERLVRLRIDGDAPGAQLVGERLGVRSYPTALLLDRQGREKLRLPGGLRPEEFARALDLGLALADTVAALVGRAQRGDPLSADDCQVLAFHWWQVDDRHAAGADRVPLLRRVHAACPDALADARLRLLVQMLVAAAATGATLDHADGLVEELLGALASPAARYSNLYLLIVDVSVLRVLGDPHRATVEGALVPAIERLLAQASLAHTERLIALAALLALSRHGNDRGEVSGTLRERVLRAVERADAESVTVAQRQTALNMAGHLLKAAGFVEQSQALFEREIRRSPHAGYFWPYVARTHFESGRSDEGLAALRQAWQATPMGCARRVRGAAYVAKLSELRPAEGALVEREAMAVLREIAPATDALAGQSRQAVSTLLKALATTPG